MLPYIEEEHWQRQKRNTCLKKQRKFKFVQFREWKGMLRGHTKAPWNKQVSASNRLCHPKYWWHGWKLANESELGQSIQLGRFWLLLDTRLCTYRMGCLQWSDHRQSTVRSGMWRQDLGTPPRHRKWRSDFGGTKLLVHLLSGNLHVQWSFQR